MEQGDIALDDRDFARVKAKLYAMAGISLSDAKRTLVVSRLSRIVREFGCSSFGDYLDTLEARADAAAQQNFVNALTTNLTRFWREDHHFDHLVDYVAARIAAGGDQRLRIWSAGCSTGQEPYTIALTLMSAFPELAGWDFRILATDIDTRVIAEAATGLYKESDVHGLSPERLRLFERAGDGKVRIPAAVQRIVQFKPLNLVSAPWPMRGPFDAIFCRNVAIYFDKPTQTQLFRRLGGLLRTGGYLYIGHSENPGSGETGLKPVGKTIYQVRTNSEARSAA